MPKGDLQTFGKRTFNVQHAAAAVLARKGNDWCPITLLQWYGRQTVVMPLGNQTGDLRTAAAGGALQIHSQHTTLSFAPLGKVEALEYPTDVFMRSLSSPCAANAICSLVLRNCSICSIVRSRVSFMLITILSMINPLLNSA